MSILSRSADSRKVSKLSYGCDVLLAQGLGFTGSLAQANVKGATTPLLDFFAAAKFSYQAFTFFLHETNPIVQTKNPVPDQGQLAFGGTLPNLVDPAAGISAPAYFQNVDLAW